MSSDGYARASSWRQDTSRSAHEWLLAAFEEESDYEPYRLVVQHGRDYAPAVLPTGVQRGRKMCSFANAFKLASATPHLVYVQGYGNLHGSDRWLYRHAWCAGPGGRVVDPTWGFPGGLPLALRGIELPLDLVESFCSEHSRGLLDGGPVDSVSVIAHHLRIQWM
jgi:hypothetical protein